MADYCPEYGQRVEIFLRALCHTKGKWAGKRFTVLPWQHDMIDRFYSVVEPDEDGVPVRARQYLYLEIPKKNGKSEVSAGLGLYHLIADNEIGAEVYLCAADKTNASIVFNDAAYMVEHTPLLAKLVRKGKLKVNPSTKTIRYKPTGSVLQVMSSEAYSKHGYSPSCVIFDELHAQPKRDLWDVMTGAAGSARRQPTFIVLTTAGDDPDRKSIGWEVHEKARRILNLRNGTPESETDEDDPLWLPIMYGISTITRDDPERIDELDIFDEHLWALCNPSLGYTITLRTLRQEAQTAKGSEAAERLFRWLRLNQWIATKSVGWLPLTLFDKSVWKPEALASVKPGPDMVKAVRDLLKGKICYAGLDLSTTTDLSAFVCEFPPQPGLPVWVTIFWAWRPQETVVDAGNRDHVPYLEWQKRGCLQLCAGDMVDFTDIEETILWASKQFRLKVLGVDPYLSRMMSSRLMAAKLNVIEIPQNMRSLSPAMKELEKLLREGQILHEPSPIARWCFGNVRCCTDGNENIKPMKNLSTGRIDITVAWIIAHAAAMAAPQNSLQEQINAGAWRM